MTRRIRLLATLCVIAVAFPVQAQQFGTAVAVAGDQVIVGDGANPAFPGRVYVFEPGDDDWTEVGRLSASDAKLPRPRNKTLDGGTDGADRFGTSVAASGDLLVVGAPGVRSAYVFRMSATRSWSEVARLQGDDPGFGSTVATDGDVVLVAAPGDADFRGTVIVYGQASESDKSGGSDAESWQVRGRLQPDEIAIGDVYGVSIAVQSGVAVVGAPGFNADAGSTYWFSVKPDGSWSTGEQLTTRIDAGGNRFGESLAFLDGHAEHLAVGLPGFADRTGTVVVFERDSTAWRVSERLSPFSAVRSEGFGSAIAVADDQLWIGAPGYGGRFGTGAVYSFQTMTNMPADVASAVAGHLGRGGTDQQTSALGQITSSSVLPILDAQNRASIGSSLAAGSGIAVVGAPGYDNRAGAAIAFKRETTTAGGGWKQSQPLINETETYASVSGGMVECEDDAAGDFPCRGVDLSAFLSLADLGADRGIRLNDLWGWEDEATGREFAIVGLSNQTSFVDVTDPLQPRYLGKLPMPESANMSVWRDMKVYRDHAYIVSDGAGDHGMQVFDLRQLRTVTTPHVFEPTAHYRGIHSAHNIVINEDTGFAYAVGSSSGGETCGGGLHMIDIREPANPRFAGCFSDGTTGRRGTGYSHDAQCVVYAGPDSDYTGREVCIGSNETALSIADVTDKDNPKSVAIASYPHVQYTHQGWLTDDHRYFYLNDELDENAGLVDGTRTMIFDLADLDDPLLVGEHIATTTETDHNLYVKGDLMYQSNTGAGLRVLDISDPEHPTETAYFDTSPVGGRGGTWSNYPYFKNGKIVVTAGHYGLFILRKTPVSF